jgi:NADH:ubiquinone oxidoreductase subunit E
VPNGQILATKLEGHIEVIPPQELGRLDEIVDRYAGRPEYLIPALKDAQDMLGYLPVEVQDRLAAGFSITPAHVYGVVTFYSFFTIVPRGRHTIRLCLGTACYVKRSSEILGTVVNEIGVNVGETSRDGRYTLDAVRCLGACGLAPVMLVGEDTHGNIDPSKALEILERYP